MGSFDVDVYKRQRVDKNGYIIDEYWVDGEGVGNEPKCITKNFNGLPCIDVGLATTHEIVKDRIREKLKDL